MATFREIDERLLALVDEETGEEIDNVAAEREEERKSLIEAGTEHLKQLLKTDSIDVDFGFDDDVYYIGDIVGAYESDTGESVKAAVSKKNRKNRKRTGNGILRSGRSCAV